ncbi:MAG: creatininase family protein [Planctomycetaceae bacterium]|nr:creatininase family protein [Planctomycetales bacterium]MCB9923225.1 creatininase family protein [Planctomycetaceae bacterium]
MEQPPKARPWILAEANYAYTKENPYEVAVLPLGATEPHNLHLPYGTDMFEATVIGEHICEAAHHQGAKVALLPTIPYGTETNLRAFPLAMNLNPSTVFQVIKDLVASLEQSGVHKLLLLNSHGGNDVKPMLRELYGTTSVQIFLCNWYQIIGDLYGPLFENRDDHAGEMETSLIMAYYPHLVAMNAEGAIVADRGSTATSRFAAINEGWVSITRPWHLLTTNTGSGNPHAATAEKGRQLMQVLVDRLARFLAELSNSELDERFPFR